MATTAVMMTLRRRLASCALVLVVCHAALVFAVPVSSCCPTRSAAPVVEAEKDCCPAGSHPPGQCPLHARAKAPKAMKSAAAAKAACRLQCDAPHGAQFLLGAVGLLPPPAVSIAASAASIGVDSLRVDPETRPFVPDLPPPRAA